jgi:hypothetical protein
MSRVLRASILALLTGLPVLAPVPAAAQGCSMCKTALTNSEEGRAMSAEFNRAIVIMLLAPYLLMGAGASYLLRKRLRALAARAVGFVRPDARPAASRG